MIAEHPEFPFMGTVPCLPSSVIVLRDLAAQALGVADHVADGRLKSAGKSPKVFRVSCTREARRVDRTEALMEWARGKKLARRRASRVDGVRATVSEGTEPQSAATVAGGATPRRRLSKVAPNQKTKVSA